MNHILPIAIRAIKGIGNETIRKLLEKNDLPTDKVRIFEWLKDNNALTLKQQSTINQQIVSDAIHHAEEVIRKSAAQGIGIITRLDKDYPSMFRAMPNKQPVVIYYKGNPKCLNEESVAIIGSSEATEKGKRVAARLGSVFASEYGFVIVSGLALGCDTAAHEGCLSVGGKTVAILPCGLDQVYPRANAPLAKAILLEDGCIISEYEVGIKPIQAYFVERDRLQSGLSKAVIVVEADEDSGTMQTVEYGRKQGRLIACYKSDDPTLKNKGNIKMINEGMAVPLENAMDIERLVDGIRKVITKISVVDESVQLSML